MIDDAGSVAAVLGAVRGIDLIVDGVVSVHLLESNLFVDSASPNMAFVACLSATKPGGCAPVHRADVEVIAVTDDPVRCVSTSSLVCPP